LTFKTNKPNNVFHPRDKVFFLVENPTREDFWVEIVHTSMGGEKQLVTAPVEPKAGERLRSPARRPVHWRRDRTDFVTVYASRQRWSEGRLLRRRIARLLRASFYARTGQGRPRTGGCRFGHFPSDRTDRRAVRNITRSQALPGNETIRTGEAMTGARR
jgi:hypothetical protein